VDLENKWIKSEFTKDEIPQHPTGFAWPITHSVPDQISLIEREDVSPQEARRVLARLSSVMLSSFGFFHLEPSESAVFI
jgi:hypothetical protein